jgi:hypothetical protein
LCLGVEWFGFNSNVRSNDGAPRSVGAAHTGGIK